MTQKIGAIDKSYSTVLQTQIFEKQNEAKKIVAWVVSKSWVNIVKITNYHIHNLQIDFAF